jgi:LL-diaminopimelate aminotransferase
MTKINENYIKLPGGYLFSEIKKRVAGYKRGNPGKEIISLGIGDVTRPLAPAVIDALHKAVDEMGDAATFKGYGPERGYDFLIDAIIGNEYAPSGIDVKRNEVFISDGSKCDTGNIQEIFDDNCVIAVTDPVYPVYLDTNAMAGRTRDGRWSRVIYMPCTAENGFVPDLPGEKPNLIYLCSPNNPTGTAMDRQSLEKWVGYAKDVAAVILYDAAYADYISESDIPVSIYEVGGADEVAVEFRSFSKKAGFTGTRCAYTVVPEKLMGYSRSGGPVSLNKLWDRRMSTKFNGTSYIIQKGAAAVYGEEGAKQIRETIGYYMKNAQIIRNGLEGTGLKVHGGVNAPYIWLEIPKTMSSWEFFDKLLNEAGVVGTPGSGFGPCGEGYFRLTAFGERHNTEKAVERIRENLEL